MAGSTSRGNYNRCRASTIRGMLHTGSVWSPDGKYLVFSRARAKDPNPADGKMTACANDPAEVPIQYELYRIPFNGGKGGTRADCRALHNGMRWAFALASL